MVLGPSGMKRPFKNALETLILTEHKMQLCGAATQNK